MKRRVLSAPGKTAVILATGPDEGIECHLRWNDARARLTMTKLNVSFGLFLLVVGVWYYFDLRSKRRPATEPPTAASDPWSPTTPEPAESQSVGPRLPPAAPIVSPEQIEAAFRLSPDRRCLWAVAGLHRLL